ncbi:hypothetical protein Tco_1340566 [Tanacetum coccineum]
MTNLKFADTHNMVTFLSKPTKSEGFEQIVDFLNAHTIKYALTVNPTIYTSCIEQLWATVKAKTVNGEVQLQALVDGKKIIITESIVRRDLQLEDAEGVDYLPNATIFEQLTLIGPKSKDTEVPQPSGPTTNVADEAVNEEMDDSLVWDATTASSLEAEKDSGNIDKTQSKATPNEPSSPGTISGGGPRRQKTMGDTIAQTRSEKVSKLSNDPLLARGNTLRSGEDSLKLKELMAFCTTLQTRVLALEIIKTTQANEINNLKKRVKRLEKKDRKITHKLKRLYKVGLTARVESSDDEGLGEEDASKQRRIADIDDANKVVTAVIEKAKLVSVAEETVNAAATTVSTAITIPVIDVEITLAQALVELKSEKPKPDKSKIVADYQLAQRLQAQEQKELTDAEKARLFVQFLEQRRKHFAAKRAEEKRNRPPTRAQQRSFICTYLKNIEGWKPKDLKNKSFANIQELFDKAMKRNKKALKSKSWKKTKSEELKQCLEIIPDDGDDITIDSTPLAWIALLHNELHKNHEDNSILYYLLVEKMYPLTNHTLHQMFNDVKLQVDYECEIAFELLRLVKKQIKEGYVPK